MIFYLPILLGIAGTTMYHVAQKSVPQQVNPLLSLLVNYATALVVTLLFLPFYPQRTGGSIALKSLNWASYAVGLSIVGVELGVLLAYRAGWKISVASLVTNVATALLLVVVGLISFGEHLSAKNAAGIVLCLAGLVLVAQK
jgi:uncharacterized membrane protein